MVRALLEEEDEAVPLPFVGCLTNHGSNWAGAVALRWRAEKKLQELLGQDLSANTYYRQRNPREAFALLRSRIERAGVFVLLKGDLGSHHTAVEVDVFRGFAIADEVAPFVVINDQDSAPAWSFTLLHELVHLMLGHTGISGAIPGTGIERLCNGVAAEWLLPAATLEQIEVNRHQDITEQARVIREFARPRNLSHTMVAYGLLKAERINQQMFDRQRLEFRKQWQHSRDRRRWTGRQSEGGPTYYAVRRHRVGNALRGLTHRMMGAGALSTTKAARILGVRPAIVGRLLGPSTKAT